VSMGGRSGRVRASGARPKKPTHNGCGGSLKLTSEDGAAVCRRCHGTVLLHPASLELFAPARARSLPAADVAPPTIRVRPAPLPSTSTPRAPPPSSAGPLLLLPPASPSAPDALVVTAVDKGPRTTALATSPTARARASRWLDALAEAPSARDVVALLAEARAERVEVRELQDAALARARKLQRACVEEALELGQLAGTLFERLHRADRGPAREHASADGSIPGKPGCSPHVGLDDIGDWPW